MKRNIVLAVILVAAMLLAFSLDDPSYYGPGNVCHTNQPTPCH